MTFGLKNGREGGPLGSMINLQPKKRKGSPLIHDIRLENTRRAPLIHDIRLKNERGPPLIHDTRPKKTEEGDLSDP